MVSDARTDVESRAPRWELALLLVVFAVCFAAVLLRKPDVVTNPQFYIEDGRDWYANAHDLGPIRALLIPLRGYLVIVQRIGGMLALAVPLAWAPLVMNLYGTALDVLPAVFLASSRYAHLVPRLERRLFLAFLCVFAPNAWTLMGGTTNAMWYLALLSCLVVLAQPSSMRTWQVFDLTAVIVSGLSGPFSILLAPVAALRWWLRRDRWSGTLAIAVAATGLIQTASVLLAPNPPHPRLALGADAVKFVKLLIKRVIYEALFGQVGGARILSHEWGAFWTSRAMLALVACGGLAMLVYAMLRAPVELRLFIVFAGLTILAALSWPGWSPVGAIWWDLLMPAGNGNRYFLIPVIAFLFTCCWMMTVSSRPVRVAGTFLIVVSLAVGIRLNWREGPYANYDFPAAVARYAAARPGEQVAIMTPPDWTMVLTKKPNERVEIVSDECSDAVPVAASVLASNQVAWSGSVARSEGGDPYIIYGLPRREYVCGVRVTFQLSTPANDPALLQFFWAGGNTTDFSGDERNSLALVASDPAPQTSVFHVHDVIDRIRLDPGTTPGSEFRVLGIELLSAENAPDGVR